jgi:4-azaleucine resistance transporter AzlC
MTNEPQSAAGPRVGIAIAAPVALAYFCFTFAFGISARAAGLSLPVSLLLSTLVYAGAAQMAAIALLAAGASMATGVLTVFLINLRGVVLSLGIARHTTRWKKWQRLLFGVELTDETFALHSARWKLTAADASQALAANIFCHLAHCTGTLVGFAAGATVPDLKPLGLDYILPAMFIALLVPQLKLRSSAAVALAAGGIALGCHQVGLSDFATVIAILLAATLGMVMDWNRGVNDE